MQKQRARRAGLAAEFFTSQTRLFAAVIVAAAFGLHSAPAQARVSLPGTLPTHALETAVPIGPVNPYEQLSLAVTLPLRNQPDLHNLLERLYNPKDPLYGHYLTPEQFTNSFGPTQTQYSDVARFAASQGLRVTGTSSNRLVLDVSGPAGRIETAFGVRLMNYRAADGHLFHAPTTEASVPDTLGNDVVGVAGLSSAFHARPLLVRPAAGGAFRSLNIGTGPGGGLAPSDIKTAYNLNNLPVNGGGETLAVMELDGYVASDITTYENQFGIANVPLENILVDGGSGPLGGGQPEVSLD
ncbi:MAG: hypothetical protein LC772_03170, partial [Chloroflexi bacterium]|nr:hypothetical protein [Chloroflexota bacterium]